MPAFQWLEWGYRKYKISKQPTSSFKKKKKKNFRTCSCVKFTLESSLFSQLSIFRQTFFLWVETFPFLVIRFWIFLIKVWIPPSSNYVHEYFILHSMTPFLQDIQSCFTALKAPKLNSTSLNYMFHYFLSKK
jgi:hypothetical protein